VAASNEVFAATSRSSPASTPFRVFLCRTRLSFGTTALVTPPCLVFEVWPPVPLSRGLPRSLPPLPLGPAHTCVPCVEGRQRAAPHSSLPPTEAPLQTLDMDMWGPGRVRGQGHERYFLLVVDDYS
ncbi:unnamed protein product, partial [Closterium sp. NIES-53]